MTDARQALQQLIEGNRRFVDGVRREGHSLGQARRSELVDGQEPMAVILGCSDSRVPAELVFDQGLGDLFVVRVAGNIAAPSQMGSVEFAVEHFGTRLVVVMGHSGCGAVRATLQEIDRPSGGLSPSLQALVDHIRPAIDPAIAAGGEGEERMARCVRANTRTWTDTLRTGSEILSGRIRNDGLLVVGAEYSLATGAVEFFDVPD